MKHLIFVVSASLIALPLFGQEKSPPLKDQKDKVSYGIGIQFGSNLARQNFEINLEALIAGLKDGMAGKPQLTDEQVKEVTMPFEKDIQEKQKAAAERTDAKSTANMMAFGKAMQEKQKAAGEKSAAEGMMTTASGLQYKVIKEGTGDQPKATDTVTVNYRGTLMGGKEFDSTYKRGQPATFPLIGVIKGWTEGLQLMKKGAKYQFFVPSDLAYGQRAMSPDIAANSTLIFEVELLDVKPGPIPAASLPPKPSLSPKAPPK